MRPFISGKAVDIKIMEESDIEQVREWRNSDQVAEFMLSKTIISKEQQLKWFQSIQNNPEYVYWIILSKKGESLGVVSLNKIDNLEKTAEPGLYIGSIKDRNSFFGMEAYFHLLNFAFEKLNLEKVYGTVLSSNNVAMKMNSSFGFEIENALKNNTVVNNVAQDVYKLILFKKSFYESPMAKFFKSKN